MENGCFFPKIYIYCKVVSESGGVRNELREEEERSNIKRFIFFNEVRISVFFIIAPLYNVALYNMVRKGRTKVELFDQNTS